MKNLIVIVIFLVLFLVGCGSEGQKSTIVTPTPVTFASATVTPRKISRATVTVEEIARITDPNEARKVYYDNDVDEIESVAKAKWIELMKQKIANITDPNEAKSIYFANDIDEIESIAKTKWIELGGKP